MKILVVANWKENFTVDEAQKWVDGLKQEARSKNQGETEIVVCPSFILIPVLDSLFSILDSPPRLGAQNVSQFEEGQYTGEVSAKMLQDFVDYVIVGHSERRRHFHETDEDINRKIEQCLKYDLTPIICVSTVDEARNWKLEDVVFVYEPVEHISAGGKFYPDDPEHANAMAQKIKDEVGQDVKVLYGGSVNAKNAKSFVDQPDISGVLVGQASLDPEEFIEVITASQTVNR